MMIKIMSGRSRDNVFQNIVHLFTCQRDCQSRGLPLYTALILLHDALDMSMHLLIMLQALSHAHLLTGNYINSSSFFPKILRFSAFMNIRNSFFFFFFSSSVTNPPGSFSASHAVTTSCCSLLWKTSVSSPAFIVSSSFSLSGFSKRSN